MKNLILLAFILSLQIPLQAQDFVSVCDRGVVGDAIVAELGAESCDKVKAEDFKVIAILQVKSSEPYSIPANAFAGFEAAVITISGMHSSIHPDAFRGMSTHMLSIRTQADSLPDGLFKEVSLHKLSLHFTKKVTLSAGLLSKAKIEELAMGSEEGLILPSGILDPLQSSVYEITFKNIEIPQLEKLAKNLPRLNKLTLEKNMITTLTPSTFSAVKNLRILNIMGNPISVIEDGAFQHSEFLMQLFMQDTTIESLSEKTFQGLESLEELILMNSSLKSLSVNFLESLERIITLNFTKTQIAEFPKGIFANSPYLTRLTILESPLKSFSRSETGLNLDTKVNINPFIGTPEGDVVVEP
ncbi:MAG: leucine-rich repeat domain-containing protein [Bdellovibrionota bacterium]